MDRLQRRNPSSRSHSSSLKSPRPPRGPAFQPPPASRPLPEPSSPDGRPRKKVRFACEAGSHHICVRQDGNIGKAEKTKPQGCNAKTTEYKFFKKLREQSGCSSRSFKQHHQNVEPNISKQKDGMKMELHNVTSHRKVPTQKSTLCSDETPATPSKNEEISGEQVNVQASHSEYDSKDTPQLNPRDSLPTIHVITPIIQTPFEVTGISRNTDIEPGSERIFSEKRRKLLKLAAKTVSMESSELLQRRAEFFADILQRLGANNIIRKHHKESMRQRKMVCRHTPADPRGHSESLLDYRLGDFDSLTKLRTGKESSSYASDEAHQFMALPWVYNQGLPKFLDWKNNLPYAANEASERMPLPSAYTTDLSSSDWEKGTIHNQVSNLLLEDVQPHTKGKPASANELSCNIQTGTYDHGWEPMFSVTHTGGPIPTRLTFPCQIEEQCAVPYAISNTFWQPDLLDSLEQCLSSSVGLEAEDPKEAGLFDNSDAGLLSRFDHLRAKCSASSFLDIRNGILDHSGFSSVSNFHVSEGNNIVSNANRSCLKSICLTSTSEHPFELGSKSLCDPAVRVSCLNVLEENYSTEAQLFDNSDIGISQGSDQLPVKFTASSFSKYTSGVLDHHLRYMSNPKDSSSIFSLDANDTCLNSLSSYSEHPCKQDWKNSCDSSTDLWSSVHHLQSHGGNLGSVLGFMSNESICSDLGDNGSVMLVEGNPNNDLFGASNLPLFGSRSTMDSIRETPLFSPDGIRW